MNTWVVVLVASAFAFLLKLAGYVVPARLLQGPRLNRVMTFLPVALLASLVAVQTFTADGGHLRVDARAAALLAAAVALVLRAPFIVVVIVGAATAALLRASGIG